MPLLEKLILTMILAASVVFAVTAMEIRPPARMFPLVISVFTAAFSAAALVKAFARPLTPPIFPAHRGRVVLIAVAGFAAYVLALPLGFVPVTLAFLFLGYLFLSPERTARVVISAAVISCAATAFTWLCFDYWLGVNLPAQFSLINLWPGATRL